MSGQTGPSFLERAAEIRRQNAAARPSAPSTSTAPVQNIPLSLGPTSSPSPEPLSPAPLPPSSPDLDDLMRDLRNVQDSPDLTESSSANIDDYLATLAQGGDPFEGRTLQEQLEMDSGEDHGFNPVGNLWGMTKAVGGGALELFHASSGLGLSALNLATRAQRASNAASSQYGAIRATGEGGSEDWVGAAAEGGAGGGFTDNSNPLSDLYVPFTDGEGIGPVGSNPIRINQIVPDGILGEFDARTPSIREVVDYFGSGGPVGPYVDAAIGGVADALNIEDPYELDDFGEYASGGAEALLGETLTDSTINLPDPESILRFVIEAGFDPANFIGVGGVVSASYRRVANELGEEVWVQTFKKGTMAGARASRDENTLKVFGAARELEKKIPHRALSTEALDAALTATRLGNTQGLIRAARKRQGGLTLRNLDDLGIQRGLIYGGKVIPGTEGAMKMLGAIQFGNRTAVNGVWGRLSLPGSEQLGRMMQGLRASAMESHIDDLLASGKSPIEAVEARLWGQAAGNRMNAAMSQGTLAMDSLLEGTTLKPTRQNLEKVKRGMVQTIRGDASSTDFSQSLDNYIEMGERGLGPGPDGMPSAPLTFDQIDRGVLRRYMDDETIPVQDRLLVGAIHHAAKLTHQQAVRHGLLPEGVTSLTLKELIGPDGVMVQGSGSLRQLFNNAAVLMSADDIITTGSSELADAYFQATRSWSDVARHFGHEPGEALMPRLPTPSDLEAAKALTEELGQIVTRGGVEMPFLLKQQVARPWTREVMDSLNRGEMDEFLTANWQMAEVGTRSVETLETFLRKARAGDGKGYQWADKKFNMDNWNHANNLKPEALEDEAIRIIQNAWYNPETATMGLRGENILEGVAGRELREPALDVLEDVANREGLGYELPPRTTLRGDGEVHGVDDVWGMFSPKDRPILAVAIRDIPDFVEDHLSGLRDWMEEWTVHAQENFRRYDATMPADMAELARNVDTFYHNANQRVRTFGGDAVDMLETGSMVRKIDTSKPLTIVEAEELAHQVMGLHYKRTGEIADFFGTVGGSGENPMREWAGHLLETSEFLNSLGRADLGPAQPLIDFASKFTRVFRSGATARPGFYVRNAKGAGFVNFTRGGVRTTGEGGYREWGEVYPWILEAVNDETVNFLEEGTSAIWRNAPKGIDDAGVTMAKQVAVEGHVIAGGSSGNILDQMMEVSEAGFGKNPIDRALSRLERNQSYIGALGEQLTVPITRAASTLSRPRLNRSALGPSNLRSATRETTEGYMRGAQLWSGLRKDGMTPGAAVARVGRSHFDYWDFTKGGQLVDELMPFWLYRARMAGATLEMLTSTPGMGIQLARLRAVNGETDPYGEGQLNRAYTLGAWSWGDFDAFGLVDDPRGEALRGPLSALEMITNGMSAESREDFVMEEFFDKLSPLLKVGLERGQSIYYSFASVRPDENPTIIQFEDGLMPRLAEGVGYVDAKLAALTQLAGLDMGRPLTAILAKTSNLQIIEGEVFITRNGQSWLTDMMPLLASLEGMLAIQLAGLLPPNATAEERRAHQIMLERKAMNAGFSLTGFPTTIVTEANRDNAVAAYGRGADTFGGFLDQIGQLNEVRDESAAVEGAIDFLSGGWEPPDN